MNGNEESEAEKMMLQSMANLQLEAMKKHFRPFPFHLGELGAVEKKGISGST